MAKKIKEFRRCHYTAKSDLSAQEKTGRSPRPGQRRNVGWNRNCHNLPFAFLKEL
jgi:hypothetical protein